MKEESTGGYLVPKVSYIDRPSKGLLARAARYVGWKIINLGAWIRSFGYHKVEIYPYDSLIKTMKEAKVKK